MSSRDDKYQEDAEDVFKWILNLQNQGLVIVALNSEDMKYLETTDDLNGERLALPDMYKDYSESLWKE